MGPGGFGEGAPGLIRYRCSTFESYCRMGRMVLDAHRSAPTGLKIIAWHFKRFFIQNSVSVWTYGQILDPVIGVIYLTPSKSGAVRSIFLCDR